MQDKFYIFVIVFGIINFLNATNYQYNDKYYEISQTDWNTSVEHLINNILQDQIKNLETYNDIKTISNAISETLNKIYDSIQNHENIPETEKNVPLNLYKNLQNTALKNFQMNFSYIKKDQMAISFTHNTKIDQKDSSDYSIYFIFKKEQLICKITDFTTYKSTFCIYNKKNKKFEELKYNIDKYCLDISQDLIPYMTLYQSIYEIIENSNLFNQKHIIKISDYIAQKIRDILKNIVPKENHTLKNIDEITNQNQKLIKIYNYSTGLSDINICFSIDDLYQISLLIYNNTINLICCDIKHKTTKLLRFSTVNKNFYTIFPDDQDKFKYLPSEESLQKLITYVMNKEKMPEKYINQYTSSVSNILSCIKATLKYSKNIKDSQQSIKRMKFLLAEKNITIKTNVHKQDDAHIFTFHFFIKDVFSIKFIITKNKNSYTTRLSLSKLYPANRYEFNIKTLKFKK